MRVVAIKDMSAGNESVGEMWQETRIFSGHETVAEVMKWVGPNKKVVLSVPANDEDEFAAQRTV